MDSEVALFSLPARPELQDAFRDVMAAVCTPVSVVTALLDGCPHGTTVSAFASLSLTPPMVLISLDRQSTLLSIVRKTGTFGVNVLGSGQSPVAVNFARKGDTKFAGLPWHAEAGVPRLAGTCGFLACDVAKIVDGGDHLVLLGLVRVASAAGGRPLTYHSRVFGTHSALEEATA